MDAKSDTPDAAVAKVAGRQHGVVTRRQLEGCGLGSKAITIRVRKGQLHRVHQGVYTMKPPPLGVHESFIAAVLACGDGGVLSHVSAAVLWDLLKPIDGPVHISVPTTSGRKSRRGIRLHRCPPLAQPSSSPTYLNQEGGRGGGLTTRRHNIPVTTVPRTIDDLQRTELLPPHLLRRAMRQGELKGHYLHGVESDRTRSDLESLFLAVIHPHRDHIPPPEVNVKLGRWTVDFLWRQQRVIVETDFWSYHRGSVAFEDDHARDLDLRSAGYTVLRFTDRQLEKEPGRVVADVARALE
jgi:hypothetical protein